MIYIEVINRKWNPGKGLPKPLQKKFEKFIIDIYIDRVKRAVKYQTYKSRWKPLNLSYKERKKRRGLSTKMWVEYDILVKALKAKRGSKIGFDGRKRRNGIKYETLARYLEYGTITIPPRPLFRTVLRSINRNLSKYGREFLGGLK